MLHRAAEIEDQTLPIVSMCLITDKNRCPPNFTPILKAHDDGSDADLWKDGFGFGIFARSVRYLALNRIAPENSPHEVITDMAVINEKEAVPTNFVCIDYTADTKERALKKKFICVRFTPRNDAVDALTDVIVLNRTKRPPKGFTSAGEVDGALICFKVTTIAPTYGVKPNLPSATASTVNNTSTSLYPSLDASAADPADLSGGLPAGLNLRAPFVAHRPLDGVPFKLSPKYATATSAAAGGLNAAAGDGYNVQSDVLEFDYNFRLERSIVS